MVTMETRTPAWRTSHVQPTSISSPHVSMATGTNAASHDFDNTCHRHKMSENNYKQIDEATTQKGFTRNLSTTEGHSTDKELCARSVLTCNCSLCDCSINLWNIYHLCHLCTARPPLYHTTLHRCSSEHEEACAMKRTPVFHSHYTHKQDFKTLNTQLSKRPSRVAPQVAERDSTAAI